MKNRFLLAALAAPVLFQACLITSGKSNIKYTKLPAEGRNMPIESFNSIKANGVFNMVLQQGTTESVVVKDNYPEDLKIINDGNTLVIIDTINTHNNTGNTKTNIYFTYKQLNSIESELVGQIKTLDTIKSARFSLESDGVGESNLLINSDSVTVSENGVGKIVINGKARYASIDDNGVGELKASNFIVNVLHASVNGIGAAKVYAESEIYLNVSGIGGVTYFGPAKVMEQNSSGIGKIEHGN